MPHAAKIADFWSWFSENEERLYSMKEIDVRLASEIGERLSVVADGVTFEMGPKGGAHRDFIVSAGGLYELMEVVSALVSSAPKLPRWNVVAFRQPKEVGGRIEMGDLSVDTATVKCSIQRELRKVAVVLYFETFREEEAESWGELGFVLLDATLGEYRVMTEVGSVDFGSIDEANDIESTEEVDVFPLSELPTRFSSMCATYRIELENDAKRPFEEILAATHKVIQEQDEYRWQAIAAEELEGEELIIQYNYFTTSQQVAAELGTALSEKGHEDVSVERTHTLIGTGFSVIGSFGKEISGIRDLNEVTETLMKFAADFKVELDGYALQKPSNFSDLDLFAMGAQQLIHAGRAAEAVEFCEQGLAQHNGHPELLALLAYGSVKAGDNETANKVLDDLSTILDDEDGLPTSMWNVACTYALLGRHDEALDMLELAIESNPEFIELAREAPDLEDLKTVARFRELVSN